MTPEIAAVEAAKSAAARGASPEEQAGTKHDENRNLGCLGFSPHLGGLQKTWSVYIPAKVFQHLTLSSQETSEKEVVLVDVITSSHGRGILDL